MPSVKQSCSSGLVLLAACVVLGSQISFLAPASGRQASSRLPASSASLSEVRADINHVSSAGTTSWLSVGAATICLAAMGLAASRRSAAKGTAAPCRAEGDGAYGASHTSFYTDAVAKDKYDSLDEVMEKSLKDPKLRTMVAELLGACVTITEALRVNLVTVNDASNAFGDRQLTVDVIADGLLWDLARSSKLVFEASSEEEPEIVKTHPDGQYVLCWDPLDGSSIVDNNWL